MPTPLISAEINLDFLHEVENTLKHYGDTKKLLYRATLMPIINKHVTNSTKRKILGEWWMDIHHDLKQDWEKWENGHYGEEDYREPR